jgi:hypothetical protein
MRTTETMMSQLGFSDSTEIDMAIAKLVFGLSQAQIDAWPWGIPAFSTDRHCSADVVARMAIEPQGRLFNEIITRRAEEIAPRAALPSLIVVLSPDEICLAAVSACLGYGREEST